MIDAEFIISVVCAHGGECAFQRMTNANWSHPLITETVVVRYVTACG
jgi:hypothetical protein